MPRPQPASFSDPLLPRPFPLPPHFRLLPLHPALLRLIPFVAAIIVPGLNTIRQVLLLPTVEPSFFFVVFALMVTRAFTDQIIGPFNMHTLLFFAASVYAFWRPERAVQTNAAPPVWQRRVGSPVRA